MEKKFTPGPWRWELNAQHKSVNLCGGRTRYDLTVIDFVRWGMGGAAPRFRNDLYPDLQVMERCDTMAVPVEGREHHANWFQNINNPDAQLIASAPELLEALEECAELLEIFTSKLGCQTQSAALKSDAEDFGALITLSKARLVINKAYGMEAVNGN